MDDKIVLRNPQKFDVGIITLEKPQGVNIRPGSFALVNQNELNYLASTCTLLQDGILVVDQPQEEAVKQLGIDTNPETNHVFVKEEDIRKKLAGTMKKLKEWIAPIEEGYILDKVYDVAMTMNLSADKLKVLAEKMPDRDFFK